MERLDAVLQPRFALGPSVGSQPPAAHHYGAQSRPQYYINGCSTAHWILVIGVQMCAYRKGINNRLFYDFSLLEGADATDRAHPVRRVGSAHTDTTSPGKTPLQNSQIAGPRSQGFCFRQPVTAKPKHFSLFANKKMSKLF